MACAFGVPPEGRNQTLPATLAQNLLLSICIHESSRQRFKFFPLGTSNRSLHGTGQCRGPCACASLEEELLPCEHWTGVLKDSFQCMPVRSSSCLRLPSCHRPSCL